MDHGSDFSWDQQIVREQLEPDAVNPWAQKTDSPKKNDDFINIFHKILNDVEKRNGFTPRQQSTTPNQPRPVPGYSSEGLQSRPQPQQSSKTGMNIETTKTNEINTTVITLSYTKDQLYLFIGLIFIFLIVMLLADCKKLKDKVNDLSNRIPNPETFKP